MLKNKKMKIKHLSGLIAAPFTPMHNDGSLNLSLVPEYYAFLKRNGVTGAFIIGSTGEGVSLSLEEKKAVIKAWGDCARTDADFNVMPLVGGTCITDCIELAVYARNAGMYAVAFTAPFYFKPANATTLAQCCTVIAESVPEIPFYYYHIPVLTGVDIPMYELLQELDGRLANFAGVKYTHEDFMDFQSCLNFSNRKYDMLWGRDENMLSALAVGAVGAVGSTFNYAAPLYYDLISAFNNNNLAKARNLQQKSIDMIRLLGKYGGIATGKAYMKQVGLDCGGFRLPVRNMSNEQYGKFSEEVADLGFELFRSR